MNCFIHSLHLFVCVVLDFFKEFIHFLLRASSLFIRLSLRWFCCASAVMKDPGLAVGQLGCGGSILPWVLLIVFWPLIIWICRCYRFRYWFLSLGGSLLDVSPSLYVSLLVFWPEWPVASESSDPSRCLYGGFKCPRCFWGAGVLGTGIAFRIPGTNVASRVLGTSLVSGGHSTDRASSREGVFCQSCGPQKNILNFSF